MEIPFNLIWVIRPLTKCLISGGRIRPREAELTLEGPYRQPFRVELGYCEDSGCWYGLFDGLERMLDEVEWDSDEVRAFTIGGRPLSVGGWLDDETGILPWDKLVGLLKEMIAEPSDTPPDEDAIRALPVLPETWEVGIRVARWVAEEGRPPVLSYVAVVLDGELVLRQFNLKTGRRQGEPEVAALVLEAAAHPRGPAPPGRPREVALADAALARTLAPRLGRVGIAVAARPTPGVDAILDRMMDEMRQEEHPAYFTGHDPAEIRAFFRTAAQFYRARPWERFDGTRYLGFRLGDRPWQYASVMGQAGEEPGLSLFDDWLQLCRFVHNQPAPGRVGLREEQLRPLRAAGALEGVTLAPLHFLHPDDADLLLSLGVRPLAGDEYPLPHRYLPGGLARPGLELADYRLLMQALLAVLAGRRGEITSLRRTVDVDGAPVRLVFPANAREEFEEAPGAYHLVVEGAPRAPGRSNPLPPGARVEVDAPGDARIDDVAHAIKRASGGALWLDGFLDGDFFVWFNAGGRVATTPRVAHLAALHAPAVAFLGNQRHPLRVARREAPVAEIQVSVAGSPES